MGISSAEVIRKIAVTSQFISVKDLIEFQISSCRLYITGCQPQLRNFYHEISLPVSPQTATISPLVKWDHSVSWLVPKYNVDKNFSQFIVVNTSEAEWSYLQGHVIGGRVLMPAATYAVRFHHNSNHRLLVEQIISQNYRYTSV